ncbi:hypothetical protein DFP74_6070 [Nocardiopsis sp. Huas11]|uniref:hypothetical protein n=1 Tax=Nocardiopsis sp. Huas11 TaxID=2183912 RepID=UPI000EAFB1D1|nr:hypothetical protein [Nocardiopsis sp. Huas11]RKS10307.1 hypothetical protein DFP74_6070 [Nocardiopsis sp. Huas11]
MSLIKTLARRVTVTATAALLLPALAVVPAANAAEPPGEAVEEVEILVTNDHEIVELGAEGEYEDVEEYLEETAEEAGDSDVSTLGTGMGYLSSGTLKIVTSGCRTATVSYNKRSGSTISVRFRVYGDGGWASTPSSTRSVSSGGYTSAYFSGTKNSRLRGEMQVSGQGNFLTSYAPCR